MVETTRRELDETRRAAGRHRHGARLRLRLSAARRAKTARSSATCPSSTATHVLGFGTYGEQYQSMHLNQTLTGIAFGEPAPRGSSTRPPNQGKRLARCRSDTSTTRKAAAHQRGAGVARRALDGAAGQCLHPVPDGDQPRRTASVRAPRSCARRCATSNSPTWSSSPPRRPPSRPIFEDALPRRRQPRRAAAAQRRASVDLGAGRPAGERGGRKLVRQVERSLETMEELLRTLLDISKLDAGVVGRRSATWRWSRCSRRCARTSSRLREQGAAAAAQADARSSSRSDRTLLRRILQNIVSNGLRYTREGGVLVGARHRGGAMLHRRRRHRLRHPRGPASGDLRRVPSRPDGRPIAELSGGGLGLGLSIVKRMVDALGHRVDFSLGRRPRHRLPSGGARRAGCRTEPGAAPAEPDRPRGYGLFGTKVLLVENDSAVLEAMRALLERWRCEVRGRDFDRRRDRPSRRCRLAARHHHRRPASRPGRPRLDDDQPGPRQLQRNVPALIITADASEDLQRAARASGVELMHKPVKPAELRALLAHLLA